MSTLGAILGGLVLLIAGLMVTMQVMIRRRVRALSGTRVPVLPGPLGERVAGSKSALVYFFSPSCGACRAITPRVRELEKTYDNVFAVDVSRDMDLARALSVMATPSTVEIIDGTIVGYHVGPIPEAVFARFSLRPAA
jgi:thioredoxin 1